MIVLEENLLPECNIVSKAQARIYTTPDEYRVLRAFIEEQASGDCWAITVDDEQLFNAYAPNKTFKELVQDEVYRKAIARDSFATILFGINSRSTNHTICIYMYGLTPYKIQITYNGEKRQYTAAPYLSHAWLALNGDNPLTAENRATVTKCNCKK